MTRGCRGWAAWLPGLVLCSCTSGAPTPGPEQAAPVAAQTPAPAVPVVSVVPVVPVMPVTDSTLTKPASGEEPKPAQGADDLAEAHAAAKRGDWAAARAGFAAAVERTPDDAGLLAELGWAEFNAGDLTGARSHTDAALAKVSEPRRRAAMLYNLGRIAEAGGDVAAAATVYKESLTLRPNKVVQARLGKLQPADAATGPDACHAWRPKAALCGCINGSELSDPCKLAPLKELADADLHTLTVEDELGGKQYYLVEGSDRGYSVLEMAGWDYGFYAFRYLRGERRTLSDGRELLRIDGEQTEGEQDNRADIAYSMATQSAHLCVRTPGSGEPAKCVLEVPLQIEGRQQALGDGVTKAPPPKIERARFELTIAADGRVSTKLVEGTARLRVFI